MTKMDILKPNSCNAMIRLHNYTDYYHAIL